MKKTENYIPKNVYDVEAVERLQHLPFELVRKDVPALLEWLQDTHWDVSAGIAEYLRPHVNEIADELIDILNSDDGMWKYCMIFILIAQSPNQLVPSLIKSLKEIAEHPSKIDAEDEVDEAARYVLNNKFLCG